MELFARKCHSCGKGMNEGHLWDSTHTFCNSYCLNEWLYLEEICYYTEWEVDSEDGEVYDEKGKEYTLTPVKEK